MNRSLSNFVLTCSLLVLLVAPSFGAPLVGTGVLPFPGATGDPPRDTYQPIITGPGTFSGTWPGIGPNSPAQAPWWGTFIATGPTPHTPPSGPNSTGTAFYNFSPTGGYAPGILPVGTYFHFGDLDNGSGGGETYRLRAFDISSNLITTPWLDIPFAATTGAIAADMPSYTFTPGIYDFDGNPVPGNPTVSVFLKNNTAIAFLEVTRTSTTTSFILAAPPLVPEPSTLVLMMCGTGTACAARMRRR
jgi:hypothetical protein